MAIHHYTPSPSRHTICLSIKDGAARILPDFSCDAILFFFLSPCECSVDVILRHEAVEGTKAGDKALFTGTLIVIPDVAQLAGGNYNEPPMSP